MARDLPLSIIFFFLYTYRVRFCKSAFVKIIIFGLLISLYYFVSTKDLYVDVINPDGINWHTRTQAFTQALAGRDYGDTFQVYHPGITLMWVSGPLLNLFKGSNNEDLKTVDPKATFLERDYYAKLSLVVFCTLLYALTLILLWKLVGFKYAIFYSIPATLEPFCVGVRRLYHLDFLMAALLFLSIILLIYFNYKKPKWPLIIFSGLFFSLAVLTKSTAIIILPAIPFIFLLGNITLLKKFLALLLFIVSSAIFIYAFFPPIWKNPIKSVPKYYRQIAFGVTGIGIEGKKEIGNSGETENVVLDDTLAPKKPNFYIVALFDRLSVGGGALLVISTGVFIYFFVKGFVLQVWHTIRNKKIPKIYNFPPDSWVTFWSIGISMAIIVALTIPVKKSDRYEILVFPFLFTVVAYFLNKLRFYIFIPLSLLYIAFVIYEMIPLHPYYLAYSNPLFGGIETRLRAMGGEPFGVGIYAAFDVVKKDMSANGYSDYYTVSGSKSVKAISVGGKFSRSPSCVTDYIIVFESEDKPTYVCTQDYALLDTVKISDFDFWYVYKRLSQKHQSNYE